MVEEVDLSSFDQLEENDLLSIDSSHAVPSPDVDQFADRRHFPSSIYLVTT